MSPATIEALIVLAAKYGPELVTGLIALFKKQNPTLADIEALFANVKPYDSYGIGPGALAPAPPPPPPVVLSGTTSGL